MKPEQAPWPTRPRCPHHDVPMLVGRTKGKLQYRYCNVPGCDESRRTRRRDFSDPGDELSVTQTGGVSEYRITRRQGEALRIEGPATIRVSRRVTLIVEAAHTTRVERVETP
ncbi:MAG: hypothetical protein ACKV0T_03935 [Planctomycetales bacterium]